MEVEAGLRALFDRGVAEPLPDPEFGSLALQVFEHQFRSNEVYRRFCLARGAEPGRVAAWEEVPPVPTTAFKALPLVSPLPGPPPRESALFRTSGTTRGGEGRGEHRIPDVDLYHRSLLPNFQAHLIPEAQPIPFLSLIPPAEQVPDSSLSHMVATARARWGIPGAGGDFADPDRGVDAGAFAAALDRAEEAGVPVLLLGTAFAWVHWLDSPEAGRRRWGLPGGSRLMETGGFKGRSREVSRKELYAGLSRSLGVPESRMVNEYGMTELCSQFYEPVLLGRPRRLHPPPWVRTRVLDPVTLAPRQPGEVGILAHFDLANLGSVAHVLTEDQGVREEDGFRVLGRAPGAEPRGCSLTMEELMESQRA